jgi:DNA mismatch repair protein MLH3
MPVRVKQRAIGSENGEDEKQLQALKRQIVGLLLAWHMPISVSLKSAEGNGKLQIRDNQDLVLGRQVGESFSRDCDLSLVRRTLSQAGLIEPSDWDNWIKISARTPFIKIRGAVSLQPAPSKQIQFISLGIHPVSTEVASHVLYDEVNRHFASSSFGNQEETSDLEEAARISGNNGGRSKRDGFTNKQLKGGGKGVDRWPMFCIRIELFENVNQEFEADIERLREDTLSSLLKVLGVMTTRFLEENHFRPRSRLQRRSQDTPRKPEARGSSLSREGSDGKLQIPTKSNNSYPEHTFSGWSRIKVGAHVIRPAIPAPSNSSQNRATTVELGRKGSVDPCLDSTASPEPREHADARAAEPDTSQDREQTLEWRNPKSGATVLINARTGLEVRPQLPRRPATAPSISGTLAQLSPGGSCITAVPRHARRLTRHTSSPFTIPKAGSWSSDLLAKWENPVFDTTEENIPQVSLDGPNVEAADILHGRRHLCSDVDIQKAFMQSSSSFSARLSKAALKNARIISQVDKKFILICMSDCSQTSGSKGGELLVLVDQHAADERLRVESLLAELHSSPKALTKPIIFEVQAHEGRVLARQASYFADWGILYDVILPPDTKKCRVSARTLPTVIAERCRIEPKVLIDLLRAEAWKREEVGGSRSTRQCPQGLLEMLNSRACRSAVMFNDELTLEEARTLIQRLGDCSFPFQCAHGRPSMIPLVKLGTSTSLGLEEKAFGALKGGRVVEEKDFGKAWREWKVNV